MPCPVRQYAPADGRMVSQDRVEEFLFLCHHYGASPYGEGDEKYDLMFSGEWQQKKSSKTLHAGF